MTFYNTTKESGPALKECKRAVNKQEREVLDEFEDSFPIIFAPSEIQELMPQYPITSIRRAITNLTKAGYHRKTHVKIVGPWKRREHCWTLEN